MLWGALHGVGLSIERWWGERRDEAEAGNSWGRLVRRVLTFQVVCLGWVLFRSDSVATAGTVLSRLGDWGPAPAVTPAVVVLVVGSIATQYLPADYRLRMRVAFSQLRPVTMAAILGGLLLVIDALGPEGVAPFIYFQF